MLLSSFSDFTENLLNMILSAAAGVVVRTTKKSGEKYEVMCSKAILYISYVRVYVHRYFFENYFSFLNFKERGLYVSRNLT